MVLERASKAAALALCVLGALSCSKSTNPTAPGSSSITLTVSVVNTAGQATLEEAQASVDGNLFIRTTSAQPVSNFSLVGTEALAAGTHTLTVVIVQQTTSPTTYTVQPTVEVMDSSGTPVNTIIPPGQIVGLATGAPATFSFSF
jgi:hypothetical protein